MKDQQFKRLRHEMHLAGFVPLRLVLQPVRVSAGRLYPQPARIGLDPASMDRSPTQPVRKPAPGGTQPVKVPGGRAARDRVLRSLGDTSPRKVGPSSTLKSRLWTKRGLLIVLALLALIALLASAYFLYNWVFA